VENARDERRKKGVSNRKDDYEHIRKDLGIQKKGREKRRSV